jgi:hypothetical protein
LLIIIDAAIDAISFAISPRLSCHYADAAISFAAADAVLIDIFRH